MISPRRLLSGIVSSSVVFVSACTYDFDAPFSESRTFDRTTRNEPDAEAPTVDGATDAKETEPILGIDSTGGVDTAAGSSDGEQSSESLPTRCNHSLGHAHASTTNCQHCLASAQWTKCAAWKECLTNENEPCGSSNVCATACSSNCQCIVDCLNNAPVVCRDDWVAFFSCLSLACQETCP